MENERDVTRRAQMGETRAALSEKLEMLEQRVVDTAHDAAQSVADVTHAVQDGVENVKDTFDLPLQVDRHPWAMMGGSIALGCVGGYLLFRGGSVLPATNGHPQPSLADRPKFTEQANGEAKDSRTENKPSAKPDGEPRGASGCAGGLGDQFGANVKKLAIGALLGLVRDVVTQSAPVSMKVGLAGAIDGLTIELGGNPIAGAAPNARETTA